MMKYSSLINLLLLLENIDDLSFELDVYLLVKSLVILLVILVPYNLNNVKLRFSSSCVSWS